METQEKQYIEGFNHGYILAQYEPELAGMLTKPGAMHISPENSHADYFQGFASGQKQYELDKTHQVSKNIGKDITPDKDKNDIGKDR